MLQAVPGYHENVTLVPWTQKGPNSKMIAWLKLTGTRRDTGVSSSLHLGMRCGSLLEFHRPL